MTLKGIVSACWRGGSTYLAYLLHKSHPNSLTLTELFNTNFTQLYVDCEFFALKGMFGIDPLPLRMLRLLIPYHMQNGIVNPIWKMVKLRAGGYLPNKPYHETMWDQYRTKEFKYLWYDGLDKKMEEYEKAMVKAGGFELVPENVYAKVKEILEFIDEKDVDVYLQVNRLHFVLDKIRRDFDIPMVHVIRNADDVFISSVVKPRKKGRLTEHLPFCRDRNYFWWEYLRMAEAHYVSLPQKEPERSKAAYKWANAQIKTVERHPYEMIDWDTPTMRTLFKTHKGFVVMRNKA